MCVWMCIVYTYYAYVCMCTFQNLYFPVCKGSHYNLMGLHVLYNVHSFDSIELIPFWCISTSMCYLEAEMYYFVLWSEWYVSRYHLQMLFAMISPYKDNKTTSWLFYREHSNSLFISYKPGLLLLVTGISFWNIHMQIIFQVL